MTKESEDERIRKEIKDFFSRIMLGQENFLKEDYDWNAWIAWLEKQGNKDEEILILKDHIESLHAAIKAVKETHRIELEKQGQHKKFRDSIQVGDKVTRNKDGALVNLSQLNRVAKKDEKQGEQKQDPCKNCKNVRLNCHNFPCIEKKAFEQGKSVLEVINEETVDKVEPKFKKGDVIRRKDGDGLEWTVEDLHKDGYYTIVNSDRDEFVYLDDNWELVEQNPAWSEEDKKMFVNIKACLRNANKDYSREVDWLKSIKPQPKDEWSEEDEKRIKKVMHILSLDGRISNKELESILDWLKSLKDRYTWKPSDEQIDAIKDAIDYLGGNTKIVRKHLMSLYDQLKKLKEEK